MLYGKTLNVGLFFILSNTIAMIVYQFQHTLKHIRRLLSLSVQTIAKMLKPEKDGFVLGLVLSST